jgi:predicted Ser/Thr protein kinase
MLQSLKEKLNRILPKGGIDMPSGSSKRIDSKTIEAIRMIRVYRKVPEESSLTFYNPTSFPFVGKGIHGVVFRIDHKTCVKVHAIESTWKDEVRVLELGKTSDLFPKLYFKDKSFIVMELLDGVPLKDYLQSNPLSKELSRKIIKTLYALKRIGIQEMDQHLHHFWLLKDGTMKVIDFVESNWKNSPYPQKMLHEMQPVHRDQFLRHIINLDPSLLAKWKASRDWPYG